MILSMNKIKGEFINIDGKEFYKICDYDEIEPFLTMLQQAVIFGYICQATAVFVPDGKV